MYTEYWKLKDTPFQNVLDIKYLYKSQEFEETYSRLKYCIEGRRGGAILVGGYGTGKSTLCKALVKELKSSSQYLPIFISYPFFSSSEVLKEIFIQISNNNVPSNIGNLELIRLIEKQLLLKTEEKNLHTVIIIDEAHLINDIEVFEQLRMLLNFQNEENFLITLIFVGQEPLIEKMNQVKQLKQRLAIRYILNCLRKEEVEGYIKFRLSVAGRTDEIFDSSAIEKIISYSKCIPREINNICDMALFIGFARKAEKINAEIIEEAYKELEIF